MFRSSPFLARVATTDVVSLQSKLHSEKVERVKSQDNLKKNTLKNELADEKFDLDVVYTFISTTTLSLCF